VPPTSAAARSKIHAGNVEKFLKEGTFMGDAGGKKMPITIEHTLSNGRVVKFRVHDDTSSFRKFDWKAVVAVVADGKRWQFSGWPFRSEADLFSSVKGYHVKFVDEAVEGGLGGWNVEVLNLKREGRHQDASVAAEFWKILEAFLMKVNARKFSNDHKL
jgi:hypothetical protein